MNSNMDKLHSSIIERDYIKIEQNAHSLKGSSRYNNLQAIYLLNNFPFNASN